MSADTNFEQWIAIVDLLCQEAWGISAYVVGPQPWGDWHERGWSPQRAIMELSTPIEPADPETDALEILNCPITTA